MHARNNVYNFELGNAACKLYLYWLPIFALYARGALHPCIYMYVHVRKQPVKHKFQKLIILAIRARARACEARTQSNKLRLKSQAWVPSRRVDFSLPCHRVSFPARLNSTSNHTGNTIPSLSLDRFIERATGASRGETVISKAPTAATGERTIMQSDACSDANLFARSLSRGRMKRVAR